MEKGMNVHLLLKLPGGEMRKIDEREWSSDMLAALNHVNYITVGGVEYETLEGRLNVDLPAVELLIAEVRHAKIL
ncbi:hypothetical protein [Cohnella zeiphila]|uniref:Uncharacterized protein n=1 Tax=Cohnella zeiphila TaxID=2761120 RepID=A0A7X0VVU5_9BACL|nr:hypothetical protein [Cohnella zeiphila]MBB6731815.1 hypothetical protein [Cohnella zeiphila]